MGFLGGVGFLGVYHMWWVASFLGFPAGVSMVSSIQYHLKAEPHGVILPLPSGYIFLSDAKN